jgi:hypothetical protein
MKTIHLIPADEFMELIMDMNPAEISDAPTRQLMIENLEILADPELYPENMGTTKKETFV